MLPSASGRRLYLFVRQIAAAVAGGTNPLLRYAHFHSHTSLLYFDCSSKPLTGTPDAESCPTASYLVASCGLSPAAAAAASRKIRIASTNKADAVLALLCLHGFSDAAIARMIPKAPKLLLVDPDKITQPKLDFLFSLGIPTIALVRASLLTCSLEKHLVPCIDFLRGILGTDADIRTAISREPNTLRFSVDNYMRPAVEALRCHGLAEKDIAKLLVLNMSVLTIGPNRIAGIFEDLEAPGLPITDSRFFYGFSTLVKIKREVWPRRLELYLSFGLSRSEVVRAFMSCPEILLLSDKAIQEKLRFFQDVLKVGLADVIARPSILKRSLEKNIIPKCAVLSVLMREGKIRRRVKLIPGLLRSSRIFSEKYVLRYANNVPDVTKAYEGKIKFEGFRSRDSSVPLKLGAQSSRILGYTLSVPMSGPRYAYD